MQVFVGELLLSKSMHRNITNALTAALHFIVDAISAFFVALVVQTVSHLPLTSLWRILLWICLTTGSLGGTHCKSSDCNMQHHHGSWSHGLCSDYPTNK